MLIFNRKRPGTRCCERLEKLVLAARPRAADTIGKEICPLGRIALIATSISL